MRKLIFIFTLLANISYASFPIVETFSLSKDTIQTDNIKKYHSSLMKMGIDLSSCKCTSCRSGIAPLNAEGNKAKKNNNMQQSDATGLYILSGLILLGVIIWSSIGLTRAYNCADNSSNCPQSSGEKPKSGAPVELLLASILILISVGVAIKAYFIQLNNKKK